MDTRRSILLQLMTRPMALAELGSAAGSSLPTLRRAVKELERGRWIRVVGRAEDTGGRPAQLFGLDTDVQTVIGVHLAHPGIRLVATDLAGMVVARHVPVGMYDLEPDRVYAAVVEFLERVREDHPRRRVLGVGVATPGYLDPGTGTVIAIGRVPGWNNLPIRDRLQDATGVPVTIGNDLDALATAEFGLGEEARTYAYVGYGEGVKFTLFLQGAPYVGPFGNAGLVGLQLLAGGDGAGAADLLKMHGLVAAYDRERSAVDPSPDAPREDPAAIRAEFDRILAAAEEDPAAARVVGRMTEVLASQIAYFVHLVQPELLVVGGAMAGAPKVVLDRIEAETRKRLPTLLDNAMSVRHARLHGQDATAAGAAGVFLRRFLTEEAPALGRLTR